MKKIILNVENFDCLSCEKHLVKFLQKIGFNEKDYSIDSLQKQCTLSLNTETNKPELLRKFKKSGFEVKIVKEIEE